MPSGYKPSPLGYGSPRSSPFRRPEPSTSPTPSPLRQSNSTPLVSPLKLSNSGNFPRPGSESTATAGSTSGSWTPKARPTQDDTPRSTYPASPTRQVPLSNTMASHGNALSKLQPSQVRTLREGFQILDRDSDGVVNRDDVADMLNQLGMRHTLSFISP